MTEATTASSSFTVYSDDHDVADSVVSLDDHSEIMHLADVSLHSNLSDDYESLQSIKRSVVDHERVVGDSARLLASNLSNEYESFHSFGNNNVDSETFACEDIVPARMSRENSQLMKNKTREMSKGQYMNEVTVPNQNVEDGEWDDVMAVCRQNKKLFVSEI